MRTGEVQWRSPGRGYVPELDGLRAIAIAPVVAIHLGLLSGGYVGVAVFFCLSGYLIASLLLEERNTTGTVQLRNFYVRRFARLYPALILMVLIAVPIAFALHQGGLPRVGLAALLALTYLQNLFSSATGIWLPLMNHTWTLAQEEQFYLVAPWAVKKARPERFARVAITCVVLAALVVVARFVVVLAFPESYWFTYENPLLNLDGMLLGTGLAFAVAAQAVPAWLRRVGSSSIGAISGLVLIAVAAVFTDYRNWTWAPGLLLAIVGSVLLLVHTGVGSSPVLRALRLKPLRWIGGLSYGIYLYHYPIFVLFGVEEPRTVGEHIIRGALAVVVSIAAAAASARWIETPIRRWVRAHFDSPSEGPAAPQVGRAPLTDPQ